MPATRGATSRMTIVLSGVFTASLSFAGQTVSKIAYDAFMQMSVDARLTTFNAIDAENRADLVRTHIRRWLSANRARLTAEQIDLMEENISFVTAERYGPSKKRGRHREAAGTREAERGGVYSRGNGGGADDRRALPPVVALSLLLLAGAG